MAVTGTLPVRDIIDGALRKIGVVGMGETPDAESYAVAAASLNRMLKAWQNRGYSLWFTTAMTVTLTTAASYTMSPVRPLRIYSVRLVRNGVEMPMQSMTRQEYDDLPIKTTAGTPTSYYYDRQREAAKLYIWPVLSAANGETLAITYERESEDIGLQTDTVDVPGEWWDAVVYGLAARLTDDFMVSAPNVIARGEEELRLALAADREGSIFFGEAR